MSDIIQLSLWDEAPALPPIESVSLEEILRKEIGVSASIFSAMEVADEEIERAMNMYPDARYLIYGSFLTIRPHFEMPERLYRMHMRELLERVATGQPLEPGTSAEILTAMHGAAGIIPLHNEPSALFAILFRELFPELVFEGLEMLSERYPGETDSLRAELVQKLSAKRAIPVERVPYSELLEIQRRAGYPRGWADEENVRQVRASREANS